VGKWDFLLLAAVKRITCRRFDRKLCTCGIAEARLAKSDSTVCHLPVFNPRDMGARTGCWKAQMRYRSSAGGSSTFLVLELHGQPPAASPPGTVLCSEHVPLRDRLGALPN
jgi:hypothetical protein